MERLIIDTRREGYNFDQVQNTMTVGELISLLQDYEEDTPIYFGFDNRYTVGGLTLGMIEAEEANEDEE